MADDERVDRQFNRAVEIVHGLPKTGPIQTAYEDKLEMYSLFKQATAGDVKTTRPGMFDMLGRAKWDAWEKQRGLDQQQAKWLYVQVLQRVLRRYSDRTVARDLVRELDSYGVDPSMFNVKRSDSRSSSSDGSQSDGDSDSPGPSVPGGLVSRPGDVSQSYEDVTAEEQGDTLRPMVSSPPIASSGRPQSALSSHMRYRTPMATMTTQSPTPGVNTQPLPRYGTPTAFPSNPLPPPPIPPQSTSSMSYPTTGSFTQPIYGSRSGYTGSAGPASISQATPIQRTPLERAIESMQTSLAALHERIDVLDAALGDSTPPHGSHRRDSSLSPSRRPLRSRPISPLPLPFDPSQTGAWSIILKPLYLFYTRFQRLIQFLLYPPDPQSSTARLIVIRRLTLDVTFMLFLWAAIRAIWRMSGMRRREVLKALMGVWHAISGRQVRVMIDKAVG